MNERRREHESDALRLLDRLMRIPQTTPDSGWPSTAELQAERIYGLRPVNRIGDLRKGKYNHHCYDFEMISCGHGVNRWRLHWPNRPGHPKNKQQTILPLASASDWYEREHGPRPTPKSETAGPLFDAVVRQ